MQLGSNMKTWPTQWWQSGRHFEVMTSKQFHFEEARVRFMADSASLGGRECVMWAGQCRKGISSQVIRIWCAVRLKEVEYREWR